MLEAVADRLEARVPELTGRTRRAADYARIAASGAAPSGGVNAFVLPATTSGAPSDAVTGLYRQPIVKGVAVVLFLQSVDGTGANALDRLEDLLDGIVAAICGWAPGDQVGVFELARQQMAPSQKGLLAYITEFRIADQLRITT